MDFDNYCLTSGVKNATNVGIYNASIVWNHSLLRLFLDNYSTEGTINIHKSWFSQSYLIHLNSEVLNED